MAKASPRLSIRVELARGRLGPGKIALLEHIAREQSLAGAARAMGMSYRRAWELLGNLNSIFDGPVAVTQPGRNIGGGTRVTALGERVITLYRALEQRAARAAAAALAELSAASPPARRSRPRSPRAPRA